MDKIPAPYLRETTRNLRVYSVGELTTIAAVLSRREAAFTYLTTTDHTAISEMRECIHAYRAHHI